MTRQILQGGVLLDPASAYEGPADVAIDDGKVTAIARTGDGGISPQPGDVVTDLDGAWIVHGLVDLNASLREPGFEGQETIKTGLAAAAKGGITAVCAFPDTDPVMDSAAVVTQVLGMAQRANGARLLPVGAATQGLAGESLAPFGDLGDHGCLAVTQGDTPLASARMMRRALEYALGFDMLLIHHATDPSLGGLCHEGVWSTRLGLAATPGAAELIAIERDLALAELTGGRLHLTKVSTAAGLRAISIGKERGINVTCDVSAHHLHLQVEAVSGYDPNYKVWPPLRDAQDVEACRQGVATGLVDAIVSDHRPVHLQDKAHEFVNAAFGISGLETLLPLVLRLVGGGSLTPLQAIGALSAGPRRVIGHGGDGLTLGSDADLTVIDPNIAWTLNEASMVSKGRNTPFIGQTFQGMALQTMVAGTTVFTHANTRQTA